MRRIALFLALVSTLPAADPVDRVCPTEGPVLGRVLETKELIKRSSHCEPPKMPALLRQARFQGGVVVSILVDSQGKVTCAQLIHGHPLIAAAALEAAKKWTFRPMKRRGRPVSFFGHLTFQFSTSGVSAPESCTSAHW